MGKFSDASKCDWLYSYLYDYLGSYLHHKDSEVNIDNVRLTMNTFGLGEVVGGLVFASQVSILGYKRK